MPAAQPQREQRTLTGEGCLATEYKSHDGEGADAEENPACVAPKAGTSVPQF